jgi:two-component system alkaline phosphatase synthesis response regulator PhoP
MATKVLLIEDEPLLSSLYASVLHRAAYDVSTAPDAESGEEKVIAFRPHVVLLDLLIPGKIGGDTHNESYHEPLGLTILRFVKSTPSLNDIKVIILSNLDSDEHVKRARELGADKYLIKSNLDPHELSKHVDEVLHGSS